MEAFRVVLTLIVLIAVCECGVTGMESEAGPGVTCTCCRSSWCNLSSPPLCFCADMWECCPYWCKTCSCTGGDSKRTQCQCLDSFERFPPRCPDQPSGLLELKTI
ncbi:Bowman-Birk type wound-induced trypsin inhibitor-like [Amborella trichopoda]|uniref:Bowman-Birk type wound-induced trypsin inhibitor-like n=1 Tax=Amborella trichopoda TaxID=13333 RepID=UPI0005D3B71A|nr:Bowman-Birk type wound-induced trypsin inhibitor-like [Amborella trichopoda]|eukprot:XP_011621069.1 Bowman-Birk type wound-induced trypsin inhibitor-like [Amborella trichopoda]